MHSVSVIIPTYNRQDDVILAVESVQNQTYPPYEIIIVDDGSTDQTIDRVKNLAIPIRYLRLEHSGLPAVARNAGIRSSTGDIIAFLDSDDLWLPDKLERQMHALQLNPRITMVCSNAYKIQPEQGAQDKCYHDPDRKISPPILDELIKDNFVITSTVLLRREGLDEAGLFSEQAELCALEDYDLWLRLAVIRDIAYSPEATTMYNNKSETNLRSTRKRSQHALGMAAVFENLYNYIYTHQMFDPNLNKMIDEHLFHYSWLHLLYAWQENHRIGAAINAGKLVLAYRARFVRWAYIKVMNRLFTRAIL